MKCSKCGCTNEHEEIIKSLEDELRTTEQRIRDNIPKKLQEENEKLRKCVEFYADKKNWRYIDHDSPPSGNVFTETDYDRKAEYKCGKKARETLEELNNL